MVINYYIILFIEYMFYLLILSYVGRRARDSSVNYFIYPIYSLILVSSTISPIYMDHVFSLIFTYMFFVSIYIYYSLLRDKYYIVLVFPYIFAYIIVMLIPYIVVGCNMYSLSCLSIKTCLSIEYLFLVLGILGLFLLNTITYSFKETGYKLFFIVSIIYGLSHYTSLFIFIRDNALLLSIISLIVSFFIYYMSSYLGKHIYSDLELNKVFDKYVSLTMPYIFILVAIVLIYRYVW